MTTIIAVCLFLSILSFICFFLARKYERKKSLLSIITSKEVGIVKSPDRKLNLFKGIERKAAKGGVEITSQEIFVFIVIGMTVIAGISYMLFGSIAISIFLTPIGIMLPNLILKNKIKKRSVLIAEQLNDLLKNMANSLKAGSTVQQAFESAAGKVDDPVKLETDKILKDIAIGKPLIEAFTLAAQRIPLKAFDNVVMAIRLNSELGGDLAEAFEQIADDIEEMKYTRDILQANTAQGKWSSAIVGAMPFILVSALRMISPDYLQPMLDSSLGFMFLILAVILVFVGLAWVRSITSFDFDSGD